MSSDRKHEPDEIPDAESIDESPLLALLVSIAYLMAAGLAIIALYYRSFAGIMVFGLSVVVLGYVMVGVMTRYD